MRVLIYLNMRRKWFQSPPPLKQTTPYDTQEFDDLLIRYVAAVSRQFMPQPTLINGKVVSHSAVKLPNVE